MKERFCPHCMSPAQEGEVYCKVCGGRVDTGAESNQLPTGTILYNEEGRRYLFGLVKGGGGFGMTYIARDMDRSQTVAIKEYFPLRCQPQRLPDASVVPVTQMKEIYGQGMRSFLSEASMLRAVAGIPSIVQVLDYFEANNTAYMVMEYLRGNTLADLMQTQSRFEPDMFLRKMIPLMKDIETLHDAGVIHRDIAPDNIMLMPDGTLKLLDFGCARSLEDGKSMTVLLKPGFAPIEQYQTRGQGRFTDIYALCATIYYCLTGKVPEAAPERLTAVYDGKTDPLLPPRNCGAMITEEQEESLMWGLALQPEARPGTVKALAQALEKTLPKEQPKPAQKPDPQPVPAEPYTVTGGDDPVPMPAAEPWWKAHMVELILIILALIFVIVLIANFF